MSRTLNKNRIRIGVDGGDYDPYHKPNSGISRLVSSFMHASPLLEEMGMDVGYFSFAQITATRKTTGYHHIKLPSVYFSSLMMPLAMVMDKRSVFLGFSCVLPLLVKHMGIKSVIFIHDLGFYKNPSHYKDPSRLRMQTEYAIRAADRIIVLSDYIKNQILEFFPDAPADRVIRVYPGVDHMALTEGGSPLSEKYFLYVGVIKQTKNIETLFLRFMRFLDAVEDKTIKLVLVGRKENAYYMKVLETASFGKIRDNVMFIENLDDRELSRWYGHATALLNVSFEEGFCFPVVEALQLGVPVITNDLPLYDEFKDSFKTLKISENEIAFVDEMRKSLNLKTNRVISDQRKFIWSTYVKQIGDIILSLQS